MISQRHIKSVIHQEEMKMNEATSCRPGLYHVITKNGAQSNLGVSTKSEKKKFYPYKSFLEIINTKYVSSENRIRGQINNSLDWVSIKDIETGCKWMNFVRPLEEVQMKKTKMQEMPLDNEIDPIENNKYFPIECLSLSFFLTVGILLFVMGISLSYIEHNPKDKDAHIQENTVLKETNELLTIENMLLSKKIHDCDDTITRLTEQHKAEAKQLKERIYHINLKHFKRQLVAKIKGLEQYIKELREEHETETKKLKERIFIVNMCIKPVLIYIIKTTFADIVAKIRDFDMETVFRYIMKTNLADFFFLILRTYAMKLIQKSKSIITLIKNILNNENKNISVCLLHIFHH